jgi:hypothetical protein
MYAIIRNNSVLTLIPANEPFTFEDIQYPANWIALATPEERETMGLTPVVRSPSPNPTYYEWVEDVPVYDAASDVVRIELVVTPRSMDDVRAEQKARINEQAYALLAPTDWMVARATEDPSRPVPLQWTQYRETVRVEARRVKDMIEIASIIPEIIVAVGSTAWPVSP